MTKKTSYLIAASILAIVFLPGAYAAEQAETERLIRRISPPAEIAEDKIYPEDTWYVNSYYEPSDILQGNRTGRWNEITNRFGYTHSNIQGYVAVSELERFDDKDYTANIGAYISMKNSYIHAEIGFGWDVDYIYRTQGIAEYGHKIVDNLYWQLGYNYRAYDEDDTHMIYPGLIYYFGDSYINADYGASFPESRDTASMGTVKGNFAITEFLQWYAGAAFGQRLYDINGLDARYEKGYILFTGLNVKIYKGINFLAGYAYGTEEPKFIKRSLSFNLSVKF